ncbi:MAG TPA: nucleotidyltransferase domain-containing protein [Firmicutes bacterium]|nr:nucleotidyltransferase domain-containing protein [Candidatus Fermentithermobacillaceae bacterium]
MKSKMAQLYSICRNHGISLVYLFGSQAQAGMKILAGEEVKCDDPLADLDVGVVTENPLPQVSKRPALYAALYNDLQELFVPAKLDLVFLEENNSVFQAEALKGICVYQVSQQKRDEYEMMILRRAADFRPFLEKYYQEVLEEV